MSYPFIIQSDHNNGFSLNNSKIPNELENKITKYIEQKKIDTVVINDHQNTYYEYGDISKSTHLASVRKSIISLLYGIAIEKKLININKTLSDLGIDESKYPLSNEEQKATIKDLLMGRSGIYIEAGAESESMKKNRPQRYEYKPGEFFYYNNWDFNVLGYIFEKETKMKIGEALAEWVGEKIGFQDFESDHVIYEKGSKYSDFETWRIYMSARDLARVGTLILNDGLWDKEIIISKDWLTESMTAYSKTPFDQIKYGYLWWIDTTRDVVYGVGSAGQFLIIDKKNNITISIRKHSGNSVLGMLYYRYFEKEITNEDAFSLYDLVLENLIL